MSGDLVPSPSRALAAFDVAADQAAADRLIARSIAPSTRDAYRRDWEAFRTYVAGGRTERMAEIDDVLSTRTLDEVASAVVTYVGHLERNGRKAATLGRAVAGIRWGLAELGRTDEPTRHPDVRRAMAGARRPDPETGTVRVPTPSRAVTTVEVARMVATMPDTPRGLRDRALILTAFAGAFRRSELVAIEVGHLRDDGATITVTVPKSKTDQEGRGRFVVLHAGKSADTCPLAALRAWLEVRGDEPGPVFVAINKAGKLGTARITAEAFRQILGHAAVRANVSDVTPHGLRAGHVTAARGGGATSAQVRQVTGHVDERMISHYTRAIDAADNSGRHLGL